MSYSLALNPITGDFNLVSTTGGQNTISIKATTVAATTAALTASYFNGSSGSGATLTNAGPLGVLTIDGVTPTIDQRILVKNQLAPEQNGIYTLTTVGSGSVAWILTRAIDYDNPSEIRPGTLVPVATGTQNANTLWIENNVVNNVGVDPIQFTQFSSAAFPTTQYAILVGAANNGVGNVGPGTTGTVFIGHTGANASFSASPTVTSVTITGTPSANTDAITVGYLAAHPSSITITGDSGTTTATSFAIRGNTGNADAGSTVTFQAGFTAGEVDLFITDALGNICLGAGAGNATNSSAHRNVVLGAGCFTSFTDASDCVTLGYQTANAITSGQYNISIGSYANAALTTTAGNIAIGYEAGQHITGNTNVGIGHQVLWSSTGDNNTVIGAQAMYNGGFASGASQYNAILGDGGGYHLTSGSYNSVFGSFGLGNGTTGSYNCLMGRNVGINYTGSESSNILISSPGVVGESNVTRIGTQGTGNGQQSQCYIAGVVNTTSGRVRNVTSPGAYPYLTLLTDDVIIIDSSVARTVNLIATPVNGTTYKIKDNGGLAATNNILIVPNAGNIDGASNYTINTNYGAIEIIYNGTQWNIL